jgi:hypothetical protein
MVWSGNPANAAIPYILMGDMNEDEDNPQSPPITSYYCPITTLKQAYMSDLHPDNLFGWDKTISSSSPTRRFDYILYSWNLTPIWGENNSQVIDTNVLFSHDIMPPDLFRSDSRGSDHLCVLGSFDIKDDQTRDCRSKPDGTEISLIAKTVTASFNNWFYIQDATGVPGIRVNWNNAPVPGSLVNIIGTVAGANGERYIAATGVRILNSSGVSIKPVGMTNQSVGGVDLNAWTPGVVNGRGPYNVGLLVKLAGSVANKFTGGFYLKDGSSMDVKVSTSATVNNGDFVTVVGVVSFEKAADSNQSIRVVATQSASDVKIISSKH